MDRSVTFLAEGYTFFVRRFQRWGSDAFEIRLLGRRALCTRGREAAQLFYDGSRVRQARMVPRPIRRTLFGEGAVHLLDGEEHRHRKAMFLSVTADPAALAVLSEIAAERWEAAADRWEAGAGVALFDEAVVTLGEIAFSWAGIPLEPTEVASRAWDLARIVDGFGTFGFRQVRGRLARRRAEPWARRVVRAVRAGQLDPPVGSPLQVVASHRDLDGELLDPRTAAVELLNIVRPTVAVAWFITFAAMALHTHPEWRTRLADNDEDLLEAFAHEVRRLYPFTPALADRARRDFRWRGHRIRRGRMVVLDVYGTCHHPDLWPDPQRFDPERFISREPDPFAFVPQGGGDPATGHRCAGERVTVELLKVATRLLTRLNYDIPRQDLRYPLTRMPTRPRSGFLIANVRRMVQLHASHAAPPSLRGS
ncbi:MAG: fatty acid alpha hydroxylase, cytochrome [Actinoallomurus sp.]|nr:fatty acid alpha hydroxylase, cytochrome [Actinoallomurus sp.]